MQWPEGALDPYLSKSGRWIFHSLAMLIAIYLMYDLFANMSSTKGPVSWVQDHVLGGRSRKLALLLLVLVDLALAAGVAFAWDFVTRRGSFGRTDANPYELASDEDKSVWRR